jgi:RNA recognition motif-containing protein
MNIYVGNLSFSSNDEGLHKVFAEFGDVGSAKVVMDRETGRSRGFGFVEMDNSDEAKAAIKALDGAELDGRNLRVNEATPRKDRF